MNLDLTVRVLAQIERDPSSHDQRNWASQRQDDGCGTAYCMAGWACVLAGEAVEWTTDHVYIGVEHNWPEAYDAYRGILKSAMTTYLAGSESYRRGDLSNEIWQRRAMELLAIPWSDNYMEDVLPLFESTNSVNDLYRLAAEMLGCTVDELAGLVADEIARQCDEIIAEAIAKDDPEAYAAASDNRDESLARVKGRSEEVAAEMVDVDA